MCLVRTSLLPRSLTKSERDNEFIRGDNLSLLASRANSSIVAGYELIDDATPPALKALSRLW